MGKKRKSSQSGEEEVLPPHDDSPSDSNMIKLQKKRKSPQSGEEEVLPPHDDSPSDSNMIKLKKKKRKGSHSGEEEVLPPHDDSPSDSNIIKLKKNKKKNRKSSQSGEEEVLPPQDDSPSESDMIKLKKKKKGKVSQSGEEEVLPPHHNSPSESDMIKLKKKRKIQDVDVEEVTCSAAAETNKTKKKKKKKRDEDEMEGAVSGKDIMEDHEEDLAATGPDPNFKELMELKEYIPDVETKSMDTIRKLLLYDLARFRLLKEEGLSVRQGRFSEEENLQVRKNVADFLVLSGISSPHLLLYPQRYGDEGSNIRKQRAKHRFLERISEGIPRPSHQVQLRAMKLFDPYSNMGIYSKDELRKLVKYQNLHGNSWRRIAEKMDRSVFSVQKRFSDIASGHGPWTAEESSNLLNAVKSHLELLIKQEPTGSGLSLEQLYKNLPWSKICLQVHTRSWNKCRLRWSGHLQAKLKRKSQVHTRSTEGTLTKVKLIEALYNSQIEDIADINWGEVAESVGEVTPLYLQKMFMRMKMTQVPHWMSLSYGEIIDFLWAKELPRLKEKLEDIQIRTHKEQKDQTYQLSDIFSSQDFMEVDNTR